VGPGRSSAPGRSITEVYADDQHLALRLGRWTRHLVSPLFAWHVTIVDRLTIISTANSKPASGLGCGRRFGTQWCVALVPTEFCFHQCSWVSPVVPLCVDSNGSSALCCIIRLSESDAATYVCRRVGVSTLDRTFDGITEVCSSKPQRMDNRGRCLSVHFW
jgi:hypothetical protein